MPVHKAHQFFFRFFFAGGHYQFKCLPFGLSKALRPFSKVLVTVIKYLQQKRHMHFPLLGQCSGLVRSRDLLLQHRDQVLHTLSQFGWMINMDKSQVDPCQSLVYFGMLFDTLQYRLFLPASKVDRILAEAMEIMTSPWITAHKGMSFLGKLTACIPAVPCHTRRFQFYHLSQWQHGSLL